MTLMKGADSLRPVWLLQDLTKRVNPCKFDCPHYHPPVMPKPAIATIGRFLAPFGQGIHYNYSIAIRPRIIFLADPELSLKFPLDPPVTGTFICRRIK